MTNVTQKSAQKREITQKVILLKKVGLLNKSLKQRKFTQKGY